MTFTPKTLMRLSLLTYVLFLSYSCNKDSDLLAEYVIEENPISDDPTEVVIDLENALIATNEDVAVSFNLLNNSSSTRKGRRRYKSNTEPKHGKFTIEKDSIAVYTPTGDFNGEDEVEITLEVINEDDTITEEVVDLELTVAPVEDVVQDTITITEEEHVIIEPLENDTFNEESEVIITEVSQPANGTAEINEDNTITYTPNTTTSEETSTEEDPSAEEDSFTYTTSVTNPDNTVSEETGSVTVTVTDKTPTEEPVEMGGLKAFPGAEGFGKNATGGRGGKVLFVTNLNDSGSGSLRAALEASGSRTVVFRVGGTVNLNAPIYIENGNLTIAGETAPGGGILVKGGMVQISSSNIIIRYMRFRLGSTSANDDDTFSITAWGGQTVKDIIIDHCSFSWGDDENFNMRSVSENSSVIKDITLQNSIVSECGYGILLYKNVQNVSFYQNLFAHNADRNIRANYGFDGVFKFEMVNNLIYGFRGSATNPSNGQKYTVLNNKYKYSNSISGETSDMIGASSADSGVPDLWTYAYISGNIIPSSAKQNNSRVTPFLKNSPFSTSGLTAIASPASDVEANVLSHVGASWPKRDAVDSRIVTQYNNSTGTTASSGTFPTIENGTPYTDNDNDGMEDNWELANNLDPKDSSDSQKDRNEDGYTNLEEFLHYWITK